MDLSFSITGIFIFLAMLLVSMTIHEVMHAVTAHWLGDTTAHEQGRITLNPIHHIDPFLTILLPLVLLLLQQPPILAAKPVPFNPDRLKYDEFGAALVGFAGPASNLVLAVLAALATGLLQPDPGSITRDLLLLFIQLNVGLFVFNMLPIPPLDGSRVLYAFAPEPLQRVMAQIEAFGIAFVFVVVFLFRDAISPLLTSVSDFILRFIL